MTVVAGERPRQLPRRWVPSFTCSGVATGRAVGSHDIEPGFQRSQCTVDIDSRHVDVTT